MDYFISIYIIRLLKLCAREGGTDTSCAAPLHSPGTDQLAGPWGCFLEGCVFGSLFLLGFL